MKKQLWILFTGLMISGQVSILSAQETEAYKRGLEKLETVVTRAINNSKVGKKYGLFGGLTNSLTPKQELMLSLGKKIFDKANVDLSPEFIAFLTEDLKTEANDDASDEEKDRQRFAILKAIVTATDGFGRENIEKAMASLTDIMQKKFKNLPLTDPNYKALNPEDNNRIQTEAAWHTLLFLEWMLQIITGTERPFIFNPQDREADFNAVKRVLDSKIMKATGYDALNQLRSVLENEVSLPYVPHKTTPKIPALIPTQGSQLTPEQLAEMKKWADANAQEMSKALGELSKNVQSTEDKLKQQLAELEQKQLEVDRNYKSKLLFSWKELTQGSLANLKKEADAQAQVIAEEKKKAFQQTQDKLKQQLAEAEQDQLKIDAERKAQIASQPNLTQEQIAEMNRLTDAEALAKVEEQKKIAQQAQEKLDQQQAQQLKENEERKVQAQKQAEAIEKARKLEEARLKKEQEATEAQRKADEEKQKVEAERLRHERLAAIEKRAREEAEAKRAEAEKIAEGKAKEEVLADLGELLEAHEKATKEREAAEQVQAQADAAAAQAQAQADAAKKAQEDAEKEIADLFAEAGFSDIEIGAIGQYRGGRDSQLGVGQGMPVGGQPQAPAGLTLEQRQRPMNIEDFKRLTNEQIMEIYKTPNRRFTSAEQKYAIDQRGLRGAMRQYYESTRR